MRRLSLTLAVLVTIFTFGWSSANAQATRTWVSGVGDDANPCSRTAPCKTFAGAISKTAARGEINVLDPGGFGGVTITKSISIIAEGATAGVLVSGTNAIVINAGANDVVVLRGLDFEGLGTGLNGIRFLAGGALHVQHCIIRGFQASSAGNGHGIAFVPSGASELAVSDTVISTNGTGTNGGGILIKPSGTGSARVTLDRVEMVNNVFGIKADGAGSTGGIKVTARNSVTSENSFAGFSSVTPGGGAVTQMMLVSSTSSNNGAAGIKSDGLASTVRISDTTVTGNNLGLEVANSGVLASYSNNNINGNTTDGAPNSFLVQN
jgi:hypothetical protein